MKRIQTEPHFQNYKSLFILNQNNSNFQQSQVKQIESTVLNEIYSNSSPQLIQIKKINRGYQSPISIKRVEDNHFINEATPNKIRHINSYNNYDLRKINNINKISPNLQLTDKSKNYSTVNLNYYLNKTNLNYNQNVNNYANNIKNQNYMNNIIVSQNLINNPNNILNKQNYMNKNNIVKNDLKHISNNNNNNVNNISIVPYQNIINKAPNNIQYLKAEQFGKKNIFSFVPKVEIFLETNKPIIQNKNIINNNIILQNNNLKEPNDRINLLEFKILKKIGQGTFGKIYKVIWIINNKLYALKKETLKDIEGVKERTNRNEVIRNFIKNTNCKGIVNLYGNLIIPKGNIFQYYELMEMCERDFEQEIKLRSINMRFYTEQEMHNIMLQLISTLSFLQKNHITHRDIKPQNILILNGIYKLGDFGDIRIMKRDGIVVQRIRGSELYMSPILFTGLRARLFQVRHNTYKSDVFSLGMCFLLASCLSFDGVIQIRELSDMNQKLYILNKYLSIRYSPKLIQILLLMLQTEEVNRPDFILLEETIKRIGL